MYESHCSALHCFLGERERIGISHIRGILQLFLAETSLLLQWGNVSGKIEKMQTKSFHLFIYLLQTEGIGVLSLI